MLRATLLALLLAPLGCTVNGVPGAETTGLTHDGGSGGGVDLGHGGDGGGCDNGGGVDLAQGPWDAGAPVWDGGVWPDGFWPVDAGPLDAGHGGHGDAGHPHDAGPVDLAH